MKQYSLNNLRIFTLLFMALVGTSFSEAADMYAAGMNTAAWILMGAVVANTFIAYFLLMSLERKIRINTLYTISKSIKEEEYKDF